MATGNKDTSLDKYIKMAVSLRLKQNIKHLEEKFTDRYKCLFQEAEKGLTHCGAEEDEKYLKHMKKFDPVFFEVLCKTPFYKKAVKAIEASKKKAKK